MMLEIKVGEHADNRVGVEHLQKLYDTTKEGIEARQPLQFVPANPGRFFCAGFDLHNLMQHTEQQVAATFETFLHFTRLVFHAPVPVSVAAHGHAIGLGAMLCLAADSASLHRKAKLRFPEAFLGLGLFDDIVQLIQYRGAAATAELLIRQGRALSGEESQKLGLVSQVHDDQDTVGDLTAAFTTNVPHQAYSEMKRLCRHRHLTEDVATQVTNFMALWVCSDTQSRMRALAAG